MHAYDFWTENGTASSGPYPIASLVLHTSGKYEGSELQAQFPSEMPDAQKLAVADRVLAGVQQWRDSIAEAMDRQRTAEDELAEARAEIARLKAERDGGDGA